MVSDYIKSGKRVGRKGFDIDNNLIKRLYLDEALTMKQIGKKLGISHWTVLNRLKKIDVKKNIRHSVNHDIFGSFTPESCYWAGFIAADGCINSNKRNVGIELAYIDNQHLKNLCGVVERDDMVWVRERESGGKIYKYSSVSIVSKKIVSDLSDNFSVTPKKSLTLQPPNNLPKEYVHHFIRGYIDGDGHIGWHKHNNKPRISVCSGSKKLLEWLTCGIKNNVKTGNPKIRKSKNKDLYNIEFMGNQVYDILDWLYKDSSPQTRLERKYERYTKYNELQ